VRYRPDIRAAEAELHAATAEIGVATADLYPKLELTGSITQGALHPQDLFSYAATGFDVGPALTVPLFRGEELRAKKRMAQDAARQALANYEQTVLKAFVQVADSLSAISHDDQAIIDATRQLDAATESLRLQRLRYQDGKTGLLPVLDAQRSWARARMALVQARARRLQDSAALLYAVSRNWDRSATDPKPGAIASAVSDKH
jgi:outer membrane protein TolC